MSKITVKDLAETVKTPVEKLMEQLSAAGIKVKGPEDAITDEQKSLYWLICKKSHGGSESTGPKKLLLIVLKRAL